MGFKLFKRYLFIFILLISVFFLNISETGNYSRQVNNNISDEVYLGGYSVGIYLKYSGLTVAKIGTFNNNNSICVCPCKNIVKKGDVIKQINGIDVNDKLTFNAIIEENGIEPVTLKIIRNGNELTVRVTPDYDKDIKAKLGLWVRDDTQGIGTMTHIKKDGYFGALGHGVNDIDCGNIISINDGKIYASNLMGIKKGQNGSPGELISSINYNSKYYLGNIYKNSIYGIYGKLNEIPKDLKVVKVGSMYEIEKGKAYIYSYIDNELKAYEIEIVNLDYSKSTTNKGIEFVVKDKELIAKTNGIVQGMSGSPIVQNDKLIGAVTHVFVNDPKRGYGVYIDNMINN